MAVHPTRWRIHLHALSDPPPNLVGKRKHNKWAAWELYLVGDVGDPVYSDIEFCCLQVCYVVIPDRVLPREGRDAAIHDHPMIIVSTLSTAVGAECERDAAPLLFFFSLSVLLFSFLSFFKFFLYCTPQRILFFSSRHRVSMEPTLYQPPSLPGIDPLSLHRAPRTKI